jgi:hypothetical protein
MLPDRMVYTLPQIPTTPEPTQTVQVALTSVRLSAETSKGSRGRPSSSSSSSSSSASSLAQRPQKHMRARETRMSLPIARRAAHVDLCCHTPHIVWYRADQWGHVRPVATDWPSPAGGGVPQAGSTTRCIPPLNMPCHRATTPHRFGDNYHLSAARFVCVTPVSSPSTK